MHYERESRQGSYPQRSAATQMASFMCDQTRVKSDSLSFVELKALDFRVVLCEVEVNRVGDGFTHIRISCFILACTAKGNTHIALVFVTDSLDDLIQLLPLVGTLLQV